MIASADLDALREEVLAVPEEALEEWLGKLSEDERETVALALARPGLLPHQFPPDGDWRIWLLLAGRGSGKSLASAVWFDQHMTGPPCDDRLPGGHQALIVAPTQGDATLSCVEGPSGLKMLNPSVRSVTTKGGTHAIWPHGARALLLGAHTDDDVDRFRSAGNRCALWAEELAAWRKAERAWEVMDFSIRTVGDDPPLIVASTTPKARPILRTLLTKTPGVKVTRASMRDNPFLNAIRRQELIDKYEGTRLGRQELEGEYLEDTEGALWNAANLAEHRVAVAPALDMLALGVDPPGTTAECGIVAVGGRLLTRPGQPSLVDLYVTGDWSMAGLPESWAHAVAGAYRSSAAGVIVFEQNQGWAMGPAIMRQEDATLPVRPVTASKGKATRAEPFSLMAEQGRFHLVGGPYESLEDQMCTWTPGEESPDRLDAMVWAATWVLERLSRGQATSAVPRGPAIQRDVLRPVAVPPTLRRG